MIGSAPSVSSKTLSTGDAFKVAWWGRWIILATVTATVLAAASNALQRTVPHEAKMLLNLREGGTGATNDVELVREHSFHELLGSTAVAEVLTTKHQMLPKVFPENWNQETKSWNRPPREGALGNLRKRLRAYLSIPPWQEPDASSLAEYLGRIRWLVRWETPGVIEVSFRHPDPDFARSFLELTLESGDSVLRRQDRRRLISRMKHLRSRLASTSVVEYRRSLVAQIAAIQQQLLLIDMSPRYAFGVLDGPYVSINRGAWSDVKLTLCLALAGSLALGFAISLTAHGLRGTRRTDRRRRIR